MSSALINHIQKQIAATQNALYDLQIDLQKAMSEDNMDIPFSEIWSATHPPTLKAEAPPFYPVHAEGTKLKWVLDTENYRVAIAKANGILEVKCVIDGGGYCHDYKDCVCKPCSEIRISGGALPPWLKGAPLMKTFFEDEAAWRASLPAGGTISVTPPILSDCALKALCMKPLTATSDAERLKELEMRFPGAHMVLSTTDSQYTITYKEDHVYGSIHCEDAHISAPYFSDFGISTIGKPNLMAEWRGLYICLSHLF